MSEDRFRLAREQFAGALQRLDEALAEPETSPIRDALIQRFEFTYELAWKCMFYWLRVQGEKAPDVVRAVLQAAYRAELIGDPQIWELIKDCRNETSHTYDEARAIEVAAFIRASAVAAFRTLEQKLAAL